MLTIDQGEAVLSAAATRAAEAAAIAAGTPALTLMERAVAGAALAIARTWSPRPTLVLCGPGNNGGDGYGVARALAGRGFDVTVAALAPPAAAPATIMADGWTGPATTLSEARPAPLIVDALFGTGLSRPLPDDVQAQLRRLAAHSRAIAAIDIVSGIAADTGADLGAATDADLTIAFGTAKPGHLIGAGAARCGRLVTADIGLDPGAAPIRIVPSPHRCPLAANVHKYRRGAVLVVEGDVGRGGASQLTALAALRAGAGLVTIAGEGAELPAAAVMRRDDRAGRAMLDDPRLGAVAIGPGLGDSARARNWLDALLAGSVPVVIDAGALALCDVRGARAPLVLTPHDGEFSRLFGPPGADRIAAVASAAVDTGAVVLLKGPATIIAAPDGRIAINRHAAPWLATAGSGDVLTGTIAGLIAQGLAPFDAARAGAWLHGDAGRRGGPGLIADDLVALLPAVLAAL